MNNLTSGRSFPFRNGDERAPAAPVLSPPSLVMACQKSHHLPCDYSLFLPALILTTAVLSCLPGVCVVPVCRASARHPVVRPDSTGALSRRAGSRHPAKVSAVSPAGAVSGQFKPVAMRENPGQSVPPKALARFLSRGGENLPKLNSYARNIPAVFIKEQMPVKYANMLLQSPMVLIKILFYNNQRLVRRFQLRAFSQTMTSPLFCIPSSPAKGKIKFCSGMLCPVRWNAHSKWRFAQQVQQILLMLTV